MSSDRVRPGPPPGPGPEAGIEAARAARRRFIRANHPDRGGDPATFAAGLRAFGPTPPPAHTAGTARRSPVAGPAVSFYRREGVFRRVRTRAAALNWKVPAARLRLGWETARRRATGHDGRL